MNRYERQEEERKKFLLQKMTPKNTPTSSLSQQSNETKLNKKISNSNWIEWSTIQGVIARVISKSDEREARGRFENTSAITP